LHVIYFLTAIGLTPGGGSTVHIYTQTIHGTTQSTQTIHGTTQLTNWEECGPCPVFAICLTTEEKARKNLSQHGKTSVFHIILFRLCTCALYLELVKWNDRNML